MVLDTHAAVLDTHPAVLDTHAAVLDTLELGRRVVVELGRRGERPAEWAVRLQGRPADGDNLVTLRGGSRGCKATSKATRWLASNNE